MDLILKIFMVILLTFFHISCGILLKSFQKESNSKSEKLIARLVNKVAHTIHITGTAHTFYWNYTTALNDNNKTFIPVNKNYNMMINFLEAVKKKHLSFFTYISTDAVYSLSLDRVDETKPTEPQTLYGMSHLVREKLVKEYISENKVIILRPCAIYGEGDPHNAYGVMRFLREAKHGGSIKIFGEGEEFRDHLFIDDLASIALEAIFSKVSGIFNVASGKSIRFIDLANLIADLFENVVSVDNLPRKMDVMHRHYDLTKLWKAFPHLLPRGIKRGVTDLFHNGNLG